MPLLSDFVNRLGRAAGLLDAAPVVAAPPPPTASVSDAGQSAAVDDTKRRHGTLRMIADGAAELFAGKFFEGTEHVKDVLEGGWSPRPGYGDLVIEILGRTGLARRILALRALDATREGWTVRFPTLDPDKGAKAASRMDTLHQNLGTQMALYRALFKSEQWGEAIIVMGIDDGEPAPVVESSFGMPSGPAGETLFERPLDMSKIRRLLWLKVFHKNEYTPGPLSSHADGNFGLPEYYDIPDFTRPDLISLERAERTPMSAKVHHTRVLRFNTEDGHSRLDEVAQALEDYFANTRSGRRAAGVFSIAVYQIAGWIEKITSNESAAMNRMAIQHKGLQKLGAVIVDKDNEAFNYQGAPAGGLADLIDRSAAGLCAWTGYPAMILFGQDPAGFSSGEEVMRHYYDTVRVVQRLQIERPLRRICEVIMVSEEGPDDIFVAPEEWGIKFAPLRSLTAKEMAELRDIIYGSAVKLKTANLLDRSEIREGLFRDTTDILPEFRLNSAAQVEKRDPLPVGFLTVLAQQITDYYGGAPPPASLIAFFGAAIPELADVLPQVFGPKETTAPDPGADPATDAGTLSKPGDYERWLFAEEVAAEFSASKETLKNNRAELPGRDNAEPGKLTWLLVGKRPRYRKSEVRALFEGASTPPTKPPGPDGTTLTGTSSSGQASASTPITPSASNSTTPTAESQ